MCSGSNNKLCTCDLVMEGGFQDPKDGRFPNRSNLLELAAADDLSAFVCGVEEKGFDVNEVSFWYGRRLGSKKMGYQERTPLMVASTYGSTQVLEYIIATGKVDVNRAFGSDGATALHCAAACGSGSSVEVVKILLAASADRNLVDAYGNKASDLIPSFLKFPSNLKKELKMLMKVLSLDSIEEGSDQDEEKMNPTSRLLKDGAEKKEYPVDVSLPDINNGIYGSDEFRMYSFKVNPCSRAYSHDWTECPFVHPGENARRRDPRKYLYTCVPCPEFKKGSCGKGDGCEYAHGVFESWLHPAQYRTRLCKDETHCSRKVCFFAHKVEELRPLYPSTGSGIPSPKNVPVSSMDAYRSSSLLQPATSTPPMSPSATACSSPLWQNKLSISPPTLQLPGSRLKSAVSARDLELELELLGLESILLQQQQQKQQQRQQLIDEMSGLSSPSCWNKDYNRIGDLKPTTNLDDVFGSLDPTLLSQLQGLSPNVVGSSTNQLQSPTGFQIRHSTNQLRSSYPNTLSSSPARNPDTSGAVAAAVMNSRSSAFAKRSQSFMDRGEKSHRPGFTAAANSTSLAPSNLSDWSSPNGKLEWGFAGEQMNKLKKSASFGFRSGDSATAKRAGYQNLDEPDVSWVGSLVKDTSSSGGHPWVDQLYIEQEQIMA